MGYSSSQDISFLVSHEKFPNLIEANVFTIELPIRIQNLSRSTSKMIDRTDAKNNPAWGGQVPFLLGIYLESSRLSRPFQVVIIHALRVLHTTPSSRRSRDPVQVCSHQLHSKAIIAILGVSTLPAHGQSKRNASNHEKITHLTGARYHPPEIHNLR